MCTASQIEMNFRQATGKGHISSQNLKTVQNLLDQIAVSQQRTQLTSMLNTTAVHISACLGKPLTEIPISSLAGAAPEFGSFLRQRRFKRNSVRSYLNYLRILISTARKLGWKEQDLELEHLWGPLKLAIPKESWIRKIVSIPRYAIQVGIKPQDFGDTDLEGWADSMLKQGRSVANVSHTKASFRRFVFEHRFVTGLSEPPARMHTTYRTVFERLPQSLRLEIERLLEWKMAKFSHGRPERCRHRPVTAGILRKTLCRIHGFLELIHGQSVSNLEQLVSQDALRKFVEWSLNERHNNGRSFVPCLGMLYACFRMYPPLKDRDFSWLKDLIEQLPHDDAEIQKQEVKARKWVDYDTLSGIPEKIRNERSAIEKKDSRRAALLCRNELLVKWLTVLPWRQRNLRECKLGDRENGANLFKGAISRRTSIAKPKWVEEVLRSNPNEHFWQFFFKPDETKTGQLVHSLVPKQLIPLLEEYLKNYRPLLVNGKDPQTLFLSESGRSIGDAGIFTIVTNITYRYTGRPVNPHLFRDIFAVTWLENNPEDYLTLSKLLWHRNVQTTLKVYGRNFDESYGVRRMEEWLEKRCAP
jgi:integrase